MARRRNGAIAFRNLRRIRQLGQERARVIAQFICDEIASNPATPFDERPRRETYNRGPHLKFSYYARQDPETGDWLVRCRRRYWVYVEYGTRKRNFTDAQPHVGPAIDVAKAVFK